ncbi:Uncharacterised protein [Mycobacteroides abscessus subsp. abscessus]|nr:Uncharacterised protein [Mycobacteroides abscessus subsp. abscessus]
MSRPNRVLSVPSARISSSAGTASRISAAEPVRATAPAHPIREPPEHGDQRQAHGHDDDLQDLGGQLGDGPAPALHARHDRDVGGHVGGEHVVGDVPGDHQAAAHEHVGPEPEGLLQLGAHAVLLLRRGLLLHGLEGGGVIQLGAQVQADHAQGQGDVEGHPPAPGQHGLGAEHPGHDGGQGGAEQVAGEGADLQHGAEQAAASVRGVFGDEGHGVAVLPAGGEALQQPAQQQEGRPQPDGVVVRQAADEEGAGGHEQHGQREHPVAPDPVRERVEEHPAQGAHEEGDGEQPGHEDAAEHAVGLREEDGLHGQREVAVHAEVVPLGDVADGGRRDGALDDGRFGDGDVLDLPVPMLLLLRGSGDHAHALSVRCRGRRRWAASGQGSGRRGGGPLGRPCGRRDRQIITVLIFWLLDPTVQRDAKYLGGVWS